MPIDTDRHRTPGANPGTIRCRVDRDRGERTVVEARHGGGESRLRPMLVAPTEPSHEAAIIAKADVAGIFVAAHPWREKPFVEPGQAIDAGAIVGLVKIGLALRAGAVTGRGHRRCNRRGARRDRRLGNTDRQRSGRSLKAWTKNCENNPMHSTGSTAPSAK